MHTQMKHSLANLQDLIPILAGIIINCINQGLAKSCRFARMCFIWDACMDVPTQLVANAACRVGSQLAS